MEIPAQPWELRPIASFKFFFSFLITRAVYDDGKNPLMSPATSHPLLSPTPKGVHC